MTTDHPSYRMIVRTGRLLPAGPIDEERLMTYADGTEIECVFKSVRNGVLIRKLYAVVGLAVKQCPTPFETADEAIQAMKDALGIVEFGPNVRGNSLRYLRSLNDLDQPELEEFLEGCWAILHKLTGVDPLTLRKEAGDIISRDTASPDPSPEQAERIADEEDGGGDDAGLACPLPDGVPAADSSLPPPPEIDARKIAALRAEMVSKLFHLAAEPLTVQERLEALDVSRPAWEQLLPDHTTLVAQTFETVAKVIKGYLPHEAARKFVESL